MDESIPVVQRTREGYAKDPFSKIHQMQDFYSYRASSTAFSGLVATNLDGASLPRCLSNGQTFRQRQSLKLKNRHVLGRKAPDTMELWLLGPNPREIRGDSHSPDLHNQKRWTYAKHTIGELERCSGGLGAWDLQELESTQVDTVLGIPAAGHKLTETTADQHITNTQ